MIRVSIDSEDKVFLMEGHAGYAPEGQDIVCASASMMAAMLFEYALQIVDDDDIWECEMRPGYARLLMEPACTDMFHVFEAVRHGFELLAERYPEYVTMD